MLGLESKKKLIISDLDGTLLNDKSELSKETINVVKSLVKQGHIFCIATGRPLKGAFKFYKQLELNTIMCNINGSYICCPNEPQFMPLNFTFSKDIVDQIISNKRIISLIKNLIADTASGEYLLKSPNPNGEDQVIFDLFHIDVSSSNAQLNIIEKGDHIKTDPNSILFIVNQQKNISEIRKIIKNLSKTLIVREWSTPVKGHIVVEVNSIFATKGMAAKFLSAYYNIPLSDTIAFGDGINDIEMLSKVGAGFAMKNAMDQVKHVAKFETDHNNNSDGVAKQLKKLFKKIKNENK
jgi:Cof subfamily protein (haloacid dehalogenase superfamily)